MEPPAHPEPKILPPLELTDEIAAELTVLTGFDQDLAAEATRCEAWCGPRQR
ncbi:hypothetical protein [Streptomyces sp. NPDC026589]|uniref:hypothetical protein n=1 Tax=Streptomyces sp. NPDC026589 TaxID=3155609 RepID=UPI0033D5F428